MSGVFVKVSTPQKFGTCKCVCLLYCLCSPTRVYPLHRGLHYPYWIQLHQWYCHECSPRHLHGCRLQLWIFRDDNLCANLHNRWRHLGLH